MRPTLFIFALCGVLHAEPTDLKTEPKPTAKVITCTSGTDERTLRNERREGGGCEVLYTKSGKESSVASARLETEYCDAGLAQIKSTLEAAGFKCN
jgi:hypothetical protein